MEWPYELAILIALHLSEIGLSRAKHCGHDVTETEVHHCTACLFAGNPEDSMSVGTHAYTCVMESMHESLQPCSQIKKAKCYLVGMAAPLLGGLIAARDPRTQAFSDFC